ncbi:MAG: radical SAM family heme chaperone HemW [Lachnospiraceae bacterium]|nr:radical SAM family heme chaperone HemW [Lachnospiraceae bacterium]
MEIYVHVPFCVRKCRYCDFYSVPCGGAEVPGGGGADSLGAARKTGDYVTALLKELDAREDELRGQEITSIFVGGGTPTLLSCAELETLITGIRARLFPDFDDDETEFTVECNPGTLDTEKLTLMRQLGVNRLSIGLQSADNAELKTLGRIHTYEEFLKNYETAREVGFCNINVDLMSGIPGQTIESFERTLRTVAGLGPEHISVYSLILEEGTPLYSDVESGRILLPGEDADRQMYELTGKVLAEYGYERYEISNYARPGYRCRHNMGYWTGEEYLGLGPAAASYLRARPNNGVMYRYKNPADITAYMADPAGVRTVEERLDKKDLMSEYMILRLRLTDGASISEFAKRFGVDPREVFGEPIGKFESLGLLRCTEDSIVLTEKGLDVANTVMCEFI